LLAAYRGNDGRTDAVPFASLGEVFFGTSFSVATLRFRPGH
jgi:hypothetical protein